MLKHQLHIPRRWLLPGFALLAVALVLGKSLLDSSSWAWFDKAGDSPAEKTTEPIVVPQTPVQLSAASLSADLHYLVQTGISKWRLEQAGIMVQDPNSQAQAGWQVERPFEAASLIKMPLMFALYHYLQAGQFEASQPLRVARHNLTETAWFADDPAPPLRPGQSYELATLLQLMIARSDNIATNTLLDQLNRHRLNADFRRWGLSQTFLAYKLAGGPTRVGDPGAVRGRNQTTAKDLLQITQELVRPDCAAEVLCQLMQQALLEQLDRSKLPRDLAQGVQVYHKTGENSRGTHTLNWYRHQNESLILIILTPEAPSQALYARLAGFSQDLLQQYKPTFITPPHTRRDT